MKLVKASNGKTKITLSKKEWQEIGKTAGWDGEDTTLLKTLNQAKRYWIDGREKTIGEIVNQIRNIKTRDEFLSFQENNFSALNEIRKIKEIDELMSQKNNEIFQNDKKFEREDLARIR